MWGMVKAMNGVQPLVKDRFVPAGVYKRVDSKGCGGGGEQDYVEAAPVTYPMCLGA